MKQVLEPSCTLLRLIVSLSCRQWATIPSGTCCNEAAVWWNCVIACIPQAHRVISIHRLRHHVPGIIDRYYVLPLSQPSFQYTFQYQILSKNNWVFFCYFTVKENFKKYFLHDTQEILDNWSSQLRCREAHFREPEQNIVGFKRAWKIDRASANRQDTMHDQLTAKRVHLFFVE